MINKIEKFTDSTYFTNALKATISAVIPVLICTYFDHFEIGFTIALGTFLTYPSDIPSSLKHKINGIIVTAFLVAGVNLLINLIYPFPFIFYLFFPILIFILAMLSVYGQRATFTSFSALLSASLSFAHMHTGLEMIQYSGLILAGGLFYLFISLLFHYIRPYRYAELQVAECIKLTSKYLKLRGDLWNSIADRKVILEKQLHLQVELNDIHHNIRRVLIGKQINSVSSNQNRKMLIVFVSLVEILELALSTSFDHNKLHQKFEKHPKVLATYQNLAYNLASTLKQLSKNIEKRTKYVPKHFLFKDLQTLELAIDTYENELGKTDASEGVLMLKTMLEYAEKQIEKIKIIERAFRSVANNYDFKGKDKDLEKFLTPQYYPISTFIENISFSSTIFRHSLRLTVAIILGGLAGKFLPFQNVYWILMTIIIIMRPGYGLTKQRSIQRVIGTVIGGIIAFSILSLIPNHLILSILAILSMLLGFSFAQTNYTVSATFVTMYIVFIYGILTPDYLDVIQFRIVDTLTGASLAYFANHFLWPSWEYIKAPEYLEKSIIANRNYLKEIFTYYTKKGEVTTSYRLARKNAFIEIGNLMASFQRMSQEPKSKQKNIVLLYKLTELNHSLLSSTASLGTYTQSHKTTPSSRALTIVVEKVLKNLEQSIALLKREIIPYSNEITNEELANRFIELKNIRQNELKERNEIDEEAFALKMQEAQLVIEQLIWLTNLSEGILKNTKKLMEE
ncbi:putative membrane protein (TIGR01666 family) [Flavobacterium sp. 1]|uniref:FUSC family protein n=1 Tax=Flavobacterium sp. 1 TaxID=2035200 RepID=UPI000C24A7EE|nr:FUSC family membrane protein [Flavobacterium sp. 1]PJJ07207.1 putative membrane protein (TIGR01666 family) [Flavobacterium sp. 1]